MRSAALALILLAACSTEPVPDGGPRDAALLDAQPEPPDAGEELADSGSARDADPIDAGADAGSDGGVPDAGCVVTSTTVVLTSTAPPRFLSQTGLYADIASKRLAHDVRPFAPAHVLWSDGAEKQRWVALPECTEIDTSDMDHWSLPVGTKLFKEFSIGGARIETRLVARIGPGPNDFIFGAYLWNDDETEAEFQRFGVRNAKGTMHDVPSVPFCRSCHTHLPERALGFSAIQLSHPGPGVTMEALVAEGRLSHPPAEPYAIAGDPEDVAAVGYLHANCGNCHFDGPGGIQFIRPFDLRLRWETRTVMDAPVIRTASAVPLEKFISNEVFVRIAPGEPDLSGVIERMSQRGNLDQMPPIATKVIDPAGLALVRAFILGL